MAGLPAENGRGVHSYSGLTRYLSVYIICLAFPCNGILADVREVQISVRIRVILSFISAWRRFSVVEEKGMPAPVPRAKVLLVAYPLPCYVSKANTMRQNEGQV